MDGLLDMEVTLLRDSGANAAEDADDDDDTAVFRRKSNQSAQYGQSVPTKTFTHPKSSPW